MRLLLVPALLLLVACGASKLTTREADQDIRKDYPVVASLHVPAQGKAVKGSPQHARLVTLQAELGTKGWFKVSRQAQGDEETFTFTLNPGAPPSIRTAPQGFELNAAQVDYVRALRMEPTREGALVTYQVRLTRPLEHFALFQKLNPGVSIGATKDRKATYVREGRKWILDRTDEKDRKLN
jgi:hypothetical protein